MISFIQEELRTQEMRGVIDCYLKRTEYPKKLEFLEETYNDMVAKGYSLDDFMNNLRSKSGTNSGEFVKQ